MSVYFPISRIEKYFQIMKYNLEESIHIEVKSLSAIKTRFIFPLERAMLLIPEEYYGG